MTGIRLDEVFWAGSGFHALAGAAAAALGEDSAFKARASDVFPDGSSP
jgi:hypothetical protein